MESEDRVPSHDEAGSQVKSEGGEEDTEPERKRVPFSFFDDYIGGMRAFSRRGDPSAIVRCLDRAQGLTSDIVVASPEAAIVEWAKTCAFVEPGVNARLELFERTSWAPARAAAAGSAVTATAV